MNVKRMLLITAGSICLGLGAAGTVFPLLPAFPFLLLAGLCFAKSSDRLHKWFVSTKLYQRNFASYADGKGMTVKTKLRIMAAVTAVMAIGFIMMKSAPVGRVILGVVWGLHGGYFVFGIKTIKKPVSGFTHIKTFEIEGMRRRGCAKKLESALNRDSRVYADVSFKKKQAIIQMKEELHSREIAEIILKNGYQVKAIID